MSEKKHILVVSQYFYPEEFKINVMGIHNVYNALFAIEEIAKISWKASFSSDHSRSSVTFCSPAVIFAQSSSSFLKLGITPS